MEKIQICEDCGRKQVFYWRGIKQPSTRCRKCAAKLRWLAKKKPSRNCPTCKKPLAQKQLTLNRKHCSIACRDIPRIVFKTCPRCEKVFKVGKASAGKYRYCSQKCSHQFAEYVDCRRCNKRFLNNTNHQRYYCSETCRRPPIIRTCEQCQKNFRITPSQAETKASRFCSFRCYRAFTGETTPERITRIALEKRGYTVTREYAIGRDVFDLYIESSNILIEVDGDYWHRSQKVQDRDAKKTARAIAMGYSCYRIPENVVRSKNLDERLDGIL